MDVLSILSPAAWVIVLTALATYSALGSALFFAIPANRATLQSDITVIEAEISDDPLIRKTQENVVRQIKGRLALSAGIDRRHTRRGRFWLLISLSLFTWAVVLQIETDTAFKNRGSTPTESHPAPIDKSLQ